MRNTFIWASTIFRIIETFCILFWNSIIDYYWCCRCIHQTFHQWELSKSGWHITLKLNTIFPINSWSIFTEKSIIQYNIIQFLSVSWFSFSKFFSECKDMTLKQYPPKTRSVIFAEALTVFVVYNNWHCFILQICHLCAKLQTCLDFFNLILFFWENSLNWDENV